MTNTRSGADVVIVGGGIGGLSNALALTRAGLDVRVLEQSPTFGEVGAGLQIAPNATRILRSWGLLDEVISLGVRPDHLVMRDAVDGTELTRLDLDDAERRFGAPYLVIHRTDLHATLLRACERAGVDLVTSCQVHDVEQEDTGATAVSDARADRAEVVIAADGLHSTLRGRLSADEPVSSCFVAYRGAVPIDEVRGLDGITTADVVVYIGPKCHFVQYPLRHGEMFNQVAVFESPRAVAGEADWGTPDELDTAFAKTCGQIRSALPHLWRDRWWRMYDRDPIDNWVHGRLALTGDAAHPPLQYLAQGAVMAIEDAFTLAEQVEVQGVKGSAGHGTETGIDWAKALAGYNSVRPKHTGRVQTTARWWGDFWHVGGVEREERNKVLRARDIRDYEHVDWLYGPPVRVPEDVAR
ncbi:MAG: FAD-dependent oxidoreductase [Jiangellaceae bacterium]